jgi:phosphoribosylanthranilate isomerase
MYKHPIAFLSVNNLTTARYAAAMMVDYIGFCFDDAHEKFITVGRAKEIMGWVSGVKFIGEFYKKPADEILAIALELKLDMVLLYGNYTESDIDSIPFKRILTTSTPAGNYLLADEQILDADRNIFALPIYSANEDETGIIDFTDITDKLNALER